MADSAPFSSSVADDDDEEDARLRLSFFELSDGLQVVSIYFIIYSYIFLFVSISNRFFFGGVAARMEFECLDDRRVDVDEDEDDDDEDDDDDADRGVFGLLVSGSLCRFILSSIFNSCALAF